jgi:superfamily II DNA or RNA helicase
MLIASPKLQQEDVQAIAKGYEERTCVIERAVLNAIMDPRDHFEEERLNLLANLIADARLDIKIAFTEAGLGIGIYHEKMGLLYDEQDNIIAFTGSMNETSTAFMHNYETIDVFCSWTDENIRVRAKDSAFNMLWNDCEPNMNVVEFPKVAIEKLQTYKKGPVDMEIDEAEYYTIKPNPASNGPCVPKGVCLHDYQLDAINEWVKCGYRGIFDMATGTGKTYTGLGAIAKLYSQCGKQLAVLIVCPYQHLVEQWVEDIVLFNIKPIIGYSASKQKDWKTRLKDAVINFNMGIKKHFCLITTNATFSSKFVMKQIDSLKGDIVLVVDEAHHFGAPNLSSTLNPKIPYRLALSATLERHRDEEGTSKLYEYFGKKCIEYTLERAIKENKLTPYYYYPIVVHLTHDEAADYKVLTKAVSRHLYTDSKGKLRVDEHGKMILLKRARIVAAATEKISKLRELILPFQNDKHILVYCGAATIHDPGYIEGFTDDFEMRQIDVVSDLLGNKLNMRISQFTSAESAEKRGLLKTEFSQGKHIQALVAIRCLDEGVNIPGIKIVFILASSTNPKEYIQRRGRVLRKFPGKHHAIIYDFVTLPSSPLDIAYFTYKGEFKEDLSLIKREMTRMRDFAAVAENPAETDRLLVEIEEAYGLTRIGGEEYEF